MDINILVVDDEKEIADLVEIYLVSDGYTVFKANNAEDGLAIIEKEEIHLAILDIMMPGMDGLEMCKKIREKHNFPIILLSAKSADIDKIINNIINDFKLFLVTYAKAFFNIAYLLLIFCYFF